MKIGETTPKLDINMMGVECQRMTSGISISRTLSWIIMTNFQRNNIKAELISRKIGHLNFTFTPPVLIA